MRWKIYKYELSGFTDQVIPLPADAQPLHIDWIDGKAYMWVRLDTSARLINRTFSVYATGHNTIPETATYIGTWLMDGGALVWHVFETPPQPSGEQL